MTCDRFHVGDSCVTVCRPRGIEVLREEYAGVLWCFGCRKHHNHIARLLSEPFPSYYEPWWVREFARCGRDRTRFPA